MAETGNSTESVRSIPAGLPARLREARLTLGATALVLAIACAAWSVPVAYGLAAFAVVALTVVLAPRPSSVAAPSADGAESPFRPDASVRAVLEAAPRPTFLLDRSGVVRVSNGLAARSFPAARTGDPLSFAFRAPEFVAALKAAAEGEAATIRHREHGDPERVFAVAIGPVRNADGDIGFILVTLDNVTEQLAVARMRADFVANASHELRTPLASLTGFIETLLGPARADPQASERFLRIMHEQAERMRRLIDDLLSLSRLEMRAHRRPTETVDAAEIVRHVVEALAPLARDLEVKVELNLPDEPLLVRGDRDELIQVFENLIDNGLKYGGEGGRLDVTLARASRGGRAVVRAEVRDYGPGISREHLPRLTERFYRVDVASSRAMKGTGLGLAIVKHVLARHGGRMEIHSEPGQGALFRVELPAADAEPEDTDRHGTVMERS